MDLLNNALEYLKSGLSIAPTKNNQKNPALISWTKYQTVKPTVEEVTQWFSDKDVTGIGVFCGEVSNLIIVDDDSYKKGNPLELSSPLEVKTATGGRHIYFKYSPGINSRNFNTDKHDFEVRSNGVFCVMPPSIALNKNGELGEYTWSRREGLFEDLPLVPVNDLPGYLETKQTTSLDLSELVKAPLGTQHHNFRDICNSELGRHKEQEWESIVYPNLRRIAAEFDPPHPEYRVEKMIQDCSDFIRSKRFNFEEPQKLTKLVVGRKEDKAIEIVAPSTGFPKLDSIIGGIVPTRLYVLSGDTNVGKTSFAANFSVNLAKQGRRVLYFSLEPGNRIVDYLSSVYYEIEFQAIREYYTPDEIDVYTKDQVDSIDDLVKIVKRLNRYDLVVVDHIGYFTNFNNKSKVEAEGIVLKQLYQLAITKKCAVMVIAHTRKDSGDKPNMNDISGSGAFKQDTTDVLMLARDKDERDPMGVTYLNTGYIIVSKTKSGPNGTVKVEFMERSAKLYDFDQRRTEWTPPF